MKKTLLALAILGAVSSAANAQSSVTVYGVIDTAIRSITNAVGPNGNGTQIALTEGAFQGPRVGFKGEEDLGDGLSAVFKLENGFQSNNGAFDQQGQLFGRQEFIGLKSKTLGELDAGRQYGVFEDVLGTYDPLAIGNFDENEWEIFVYGNRYDNSLKYTGAFGPVTVEAQYSFGGQAGETSVGSTIAGGVMYAQGPFNVGFAAQQSKDANSNKLTDIGLGGTYVVGPATLYLSYSSTKRDADFAAGASKTSNPLANASLISNTGNDQQRKDNIVTLGGLYKATSALEFIAGYMSDSISNEDSNGDSGRISVGYAIADYHFSKRTDVYFDVDYSKLHGEEINVNDGNTVSGFLGSFGGASSRTGLALGLRTKF